MVKTSSDLNSAKLKFLSNQGQIISVKWRLCFIHFIGNNS